MEQTPWRMVKEFFKKIFNNRFENYTEIKLKAGRIFVILEKNPDESITIFDRMLESSISLGMYSDEARVLVKSELKDERDSFYLELQSVSNVILLEREFRGFPYYKIRLCCYKGEEPKIKMIITDPGCESMSVIVKEILFRGDECAIMPEDFQVIKYDPDISPEPYTDLRKVIVQKEGINKIEKK